MGKVDYCGLIEHTHTTLSYLISRVPIASVVRVFTVGLWAFDTEWVLSESSEGLPHITKIHQRDFQICPLHRGKL